MRTEPSPRGRAKIKTTERAGVTKARRPDRFSPDAASINPTTTSITTPFASPDSDSGIPYEQHEINVQQVNIPVEDLTAKDTTPTTPTTPTDQLYEDCLMVVRSACQLPSMVWGAHLIRTEDQIKPVAAAFTHYCKRKSIDPLDYFFDELPLIIAGGSLLIGMKRDHTTWKEEQKKEKEEEKVE